MDDTSTFLPSVALWPQFTTGQLDCLNHSAARLSPRRRQQPAQISGMELTGIVGILTRTLLLQNILMIPFASNKIKRYN